MLRRACPRLCRRLRVPPSPPLRQIPHRCASDARPPSKRAMPWREPDEDDPQVLQADNFAPHVVFVANFAKRFVKLTLIGFAIVGVTTASAFEAFHQWVERVYMAPEIDEEARNWEWDQEMDKWSGGNAGGTDPALGLFGRHATRAALIAQYWDADIKPTVISSSSEGWAGPGGLSIITAGLEHAHEFLSIALKYAEGMEGHGKLHPLTISELLIRDADVLARMGVQQALSEARSQLLRVWARQPPENMAARIALKIGDLSSRLADSQGALSWWSRAINTASNLGRKEMDTLPTVPDVAPSSPASQRLIVSALVSLSAFYSKSGELSQARQVQKASLSFISTLTQPTKLAGTSSPATLHALYLLHRSCLFYIHLAEVQFALRRSRSTSTSIDQLYIAARSSESVALALTGLPAVHPDAPASQIPHPPSAEIPLLPVYASSRSMRRPATKLLRDAKRTAAEAWSLIGVLTEDRDPGKALECYKRALGWVGVRSDGPDSVGQPGEAILDGDWKLLWENYVRARHLVKKQALKE